MSSSVAMYGEQIRLLLAAEQAITATATLDAAAAGAMQARMHDFQLHHKRTILKLMGQSQGRRAQQMIASRLFAYAGRKTGKRDGVIQELRDAVSEGWLASRPDVQGLDEETLRIMETGQMVYSREAMAIPVGVGRRRDGHPVWQGRSFASMGYAFIRLGDGRTLVVDDSAKARAGLRRRGAADIMLRGRQIGRVVAILSRRRFQPAIIRFRESADRIWPEHAARIGRDMQLATTAAGRTVLGQRATVYRFAREEYRRIYAGARGGDKAKRIVARRAMQDVLRASAIVAREGRAGGSA